jgi:pimeloyl-ACP methyl ester carboxylesterase
MTTLRGETTIYVDGPWSHRAVSANGTRFHIAEQGEGPLVLLLHGFPQFWWTWRQQLETLADAGYRAVAADLRGYGGSDKPPRGYDLVTAASDAAGLVRALGEANAVVVGHDWGGLVAWTMAAYFPKVVRRLAIVSVAHPLRMRSAVLTDPLGQGRHSGYAFGFQVPVLPERQLVRDDARRVGLARPGNRAALPSRDVHTVGGTLCAGVSPLVRALAGAAGRDALREPHARADPSAHSAPARGPRHLRVARYRARIRQACGRPVPVAAARWLRPFPARRAAGPL